MDNKQSRSEKNKKVNGWKWAFLFLVSVLIISIAYFIFLIRPVSVDRTNQNQPIDSIEQPNQDVVLTTRLSKEDTEVLMNEYLSEAIGEDFNPYQILLTNNLEIHGTMPIFNLDIPFTLYFTPFVMENGNIQLRGESVQLAGISLPVGTVMSIFTRQIDLPTFISVDSDSEQIEIHLNEMTSEYSFGIEADQIDLENDLIQFQLNLDPNRISENRNINE